MCVVSAAIWLVWLLLIFVAFVIIYGYVIYFKEDNTCQDNYDTSVAMVFMCIFLIFGLGQLLSAVIGFFALPVLFCMFRSVAREFFENITDRARALAPPPEGGDDDANKKNDQGNQEGGPDTSGDKAGGGADPAPPAGNAEGGEEDTLIKPKQPSSVTKRKNIK